MILQPIVTVSFIFQELLVLSSVKKKSIKFGKHCRASMCAHLATNGRPSLLPSTSPFFQVLQVQLLNSTGQLSYTKNDNIRYVISPLLNWQQFCIESREFVNCLLGTFVFIISSAIYHTNNSLKDIYPTHLVLVHLFKQRAENSHYSGLPRNIFS